MDDRQSLTPANSADKPTSSSLTANEMEAVRTTVDGELESSRKRSGSSRKRSGSSRKRSRSSRKRTGSNSQKTDSCPTQEQHLHEDKKRKREDVDEDPDVKTADPPETKQKTKEKKQRCFTCNKKVGVIGFDCRCQNVFCSLHRHSDVHNCTFDYKAYGAEKIRRENPVVVKEKIQKI